jgi:VCBS repeat-containing protein
VAPPPNTPPTVTGSTNATSNDHIGLSAGQINASDANNDTLSYHFNDPAKRVVDSTHEALDTTHGTMTLNTGDGSYTFTPNSSAAALGQGQTTHDDASVTVNDGHNHPVTTTVAVDITGINDAPTVTGSVTLSNGTANTPITISKALLIANATDVEGDTLTATGFSSAQGSVVDNGDGTVTFTPTNGYTGAVTISYTVDDGHGGNVADTATMSISAAANHAPTTNGAVTLADGTEDIDTTISFAALLNGATDADGNTLSLSGFSASNGASVTVNANDITLHTPTDYEGPVTISYTIGDGQGGTVAQTSSITILGVNDAPVITTTTNATASDHAGLTTGQVTASDVDINDAGQLSYHIVGGSVSGGTETLVTTYGTVTMTTATGDYTFAPNTNAKYLGLGQSTTDNFTVQVNDAHGGSVTASVGVDITGTNDAPTVSGSVTLSNTPTNTSVTFTKATLLANASDVDTSDTLSASGFSSAQGTVTDNGDGTVTFAPTNGYTGAVSISYTVTDSHGATVADTATLTVTQVLQVTGGGTILQVLTPTMLADADFSGYSGLHALTFETTGTQGAVMSTNAIASGITVVSSFMSAQGVSVDASADTLNITFNGGSGNDTFIGGSGDNTFFAAGGGDTLTGGAGADTFVYTDAGETQDATVSRDVITDFQTGTDHIKISLTGSYVDVSSFASAASYNGGQTTLAMTGAIGDGFYSSGDQAFYIYTQPNTTAIGTGYVISSANAINAADLQFAITGTSGADTLVGGIGNDSIDGGDGNDTITGSGGADSIQGGLGDDIIRMTSAALASSSIDGGTGTNTLTLTDAGTLTDTAFSSVTNIHTLALASGDSVALGANSLAAGIAVIDASAATTATVDATARIDVTTFIAGTGVETFLGGSGPNTIQTTTAELHNLTLTGNGTGSLEIQLTDAGTVTDADFAGVTQSYGHLIIHDGDVVTLGSNFEAAGMSSVDASATTAGVTVDASATTSYSLFVAGSGADTFTGGHGSNTIYESSGSLMAADTIDGGTGTATLTISTTGAVVVDSDFAHVTHVSTLQVADDASVTLGANSQTAGITTVDASVASTAVTLDASARTNSIALLSGAGADTLTAGSGTTAMTGGAGSDTFVMSATGTASIADFTVADDHIQVNQSDFAGSLGATGTLDVTHYTEDSNSAHAINGTAQDFNAGTHVAGIVAIDNGGGATLWYTADMAAADTTNSHQLATVTVNTAALDNTHFTVHL